VNFGSGGIDRFGNEIQTAMQKEPQNKKENASLHPLGSFLIN
jgi:hypothetical protein